MLIALNSKLRCSITQALEFGADQHMMACICGKPIRKKEQPIVSIYVMLMGLTSVDLDLVRCNQGSDDGRQSERVGTVTLKLTMFWLIGCVQIGQGRNGLLEQPGSISYAMHMFSCLSLFHLPPSLGVEKQKRRKQLNCCVYRKSHYSWDMCPRKEHSPGLPADRPIS